VRRSNDVNGQTSGLGLVQNRSAAFCVAGLMALTLVGAGSWLWGQQTAVIRAVADARAGAQALSARIPRVGIVVGLLSEDPAAIKKLDQLVSGQGAEVLGVTLRTADGKAVYAKDKAVRGKTAPLDRTALQSLRSGMSATELKLSSDPSDTVLRINQPVGAGNGALLLQMDYDYESITAGARRTWRVFAPVTLGALVLMAALWLCLAGLAARRARKYDIAAPLPQKEPEAWLEPEPVQEVVARAFSAPPRRPTAGEPAPKLTPSDRVGPEPLMDDDWFGTVQGGTPWPAVPFTEPVCEDDVALPGALRDGGSRARPCPDALGAQPIVEEFEAITSGLAEAECSDGTRNGRHASTSGNRASENGRSNGHGRLNGARNGHIAAGTKMNGNSRRRGLEMALSGMLLPLARRGIDTRLDLPPGLQLSDATEELLIRAAEEAVRHSVSHSDTKTVKVRLDVREQRVELTVDNDGRGFDLVQLNGDHGDPGLRTLTRLAADAGGALHIRSSPHRGTRLHIDLPAV
jgi:histidine kinase/DNA gyrase B/HSP90-like ATPase